MTCSAVRSTLSLRIPDRRFSALMTEISDAYEGFQFFRIFQAVQRFCVVDLSNFYLDTAKDRLYIRDKQVIRFAKFVCFHQI